MKIIFFPLDGDCPVGQILLNLPDEIQEREVNPFISKTIYALCYNNLMSKLPSYNLYLDLK